MCPSDLNWNHRARKINKYQKQKGNGEIQNQLTQQQHIRHNFRLFIIWKKRICCTENHFK